MVPADDGMLAASQRLEDVAARSAKRSEPTPAVGQTEKKKKSYRLFGSSAVSSAAFSGIGFGSPRRSLIFSAREFLLLLIDGDI